MIYFDHLKLSENILKSLSVLKIDYVFQPIFLKDGKTVFAREALMRPHDMTVTELIEEYTELGQLHILEIATFFGATQAYILRGYTEKVSINSFPSECFTEEEGAVYDEYFGDIKGQMIIEILEYPSLSIDRYSNKREHALSKDNIIAVDDYGTGISDMETVDILKPHIIKLDRSLISDIDKDVYKQANCREIVDMLHSQNFKIVAEGIETKEEFDHLVSLDVDYFQGYYLARPS